MLPPGPQLRLSPTTVEVAIDIVEVPVEEAIELDVQLPANGWTVEPSRVKVTFSAPPTLMARIRETAKATVAVSGLGPKGGSVEVSVQLEELEPEEQSLVEVLGTVPARVTVRRAR
ncbi:MAG: hypothetical protein JSV80_15715 [Acidobacteriota bacterium]|nr:MAG: hypothetical protein JSV80_15715 [Acidobacteriota bacterium]